MSTKVLTSLVDDIDGSEAEGTVRFGLDGSEYEIDLNADHAGDLRDALSKYVNAARRSNGSAPKRGARGARPAGRAAASARPPAGRVPAAVFVEPTDRRAAVRAWAKANPEALRSVGLEPVADRGRIAVKVYELYDARPL